MDSSKPPTQVAGELTRLLATLKAGDSSAKHELFPVVYAELRALAQTVLEDERSNHTLQATALVHEAYLKLIDQKVATWQNRAQFFAIAAQAMRRILVDHARARKRLKRGGTLTRLAFSQDLATTVDPTLDVLAINDALERLATKSPVDARVVEMRFFGGLNESEIAAALAMSERTVRRHWNYAKAWLYRELNRGTTRVQAKTKQSTA